MASVGISQAELARRVGITQPAVNHLIKRGSGGSAHLHKIARVLATSPEYLTGETDDPAQTPSTLSDDRNSFRGFPSDVDPGTVEVVVSDIAYGLGGTYIDDASAETSVERFPRAFIRQFTKGPLNQLYFAAGFGDSMEPTIHTSDLILIDRSQETLRVSDQIWAVAVGEVCMVKRVRMASRQELLLVSDKPGVSDYLVAENELRLIGRVVGVVKRL